MSEPPVFDVLGPLPVGTTVLEASAGTGKTFTIAALAARYVADGVPLGRVLLVTFTRAATSELRERVRERLVHAERAVERALAGVPDAGPDPDADAVSELLATGAEPELRVRRERLARAVSDFDAATITTTHGFCQEVLHGLGTIGDVERDVTFLEDVSDLREQALDDLYVRRFVGEAPRIDHAQALAIARAAVDNPAARLEPADAAGGDLPGMRARLAAAVRAEVEDRKRLAGVMTYDDLLTRLRATLAGPDGAEAAARLRGRYDAVLVDEFQDTDPVQWEILDLAFGERGPTGTATPPADGRPGRALVLIGDPKQAIYAFRGADVFAYLEAAGSARRATLGTNWRTDQALLDAYDAVFGGAHLGHEGIAYRPVSAPEERAEHGLHGAPVGAPLRLRMVLREELEDGRTPKGYARKPVVDAHVVRDLAADVARLLDSPAEIEREPGVRERVRPGDVAVLVRLNRQAATVRAALAAAGVPAVISGAGSVFATDPARAWLRLLEALERPSAAGRARAVALTPFLGWPAAAVAAAGEEDWEDVHRRLHRWARLLRSRGVAALLEHVTAVEALAERILAEPDGERRLTDLRHVGQLLHGAASAERLGITALATWLRQRIADAEREGDEERSRRLESDAEAVQVLTVHRSKGLEFGIVYYPALGEPSPIFDGSPVTFHDPTAGNARVLDVGLDGPGWDRSLARHRVEARGEDLRLAYVALTRARHQAVVWWAGTYGSRDGPLPRLLFDRRPDGTVPPQGRRVPTDAEAAGSSADPAPGSFRELVLRSAGRIRLEAARVGEAVPPGEPGAPRPVLAVAPFAREVDRLWRRTSYSDLVAGRDLAAEVETVASEPEAAGIDDEPEEPAPPAGAADLGGRGGPGTPAPMADLPAGPRFGTTVHHVLEATDFAALDVDAGLRDALAAELARRPTDVGDEAVLLAALRGVLETPLGPTFGDVRLRDVARADRLDELVFELPLDGGERPGRAPAASARLDDVAEVLRRHAPSGSPLAAYAEDLGRPGLRRTLRGYLTGAIDLVVRLPDGRYAVLDHKTNRLAPRGVPLLVEDHAPPRLEAEMRRAHYWLQALLYAVALHRYLRWRVPGHDPDRDIAGVGYLFLRGMAGPDAPAADGGPHGVCAWRPDGALVRALSDALDGRASA